MFQAVGSNAQRATRRSADKFGARRDELAEATLQTLGELGYARATLREVAGRAGISHGVLHYYFADKIDLISQCVRLAKDRCIGRYADVVAAGTADDVIDSFVGALEETLRDHASAQRLWYDLRLESLFEPSIRDEVTAIDGALRDMVWQIVERYADLSGHRVAVDPDGVYAIFDGVFSQLVMQQAAGVEGLEWVLAERVRLLMPRLLMPGR